MNEVLTQGAPIAPSNRRLQRGYPTQTGVKEDERPLPNFFRTNLGDYKKVIPIYSTSIEAPPH